MTNTHTGKVDVEAREEFRGHYFKETLLPCRMCDGDIDTCRHSYAERDANERARTALSTGGE